MKRMTTLLLQLLGCVLFSATASAFVRTPTCYLNNPSSPFACRDGETPQPIFWPQQCVLYEVNQAGLSTVPEFDDLLAAIEISFDPWRDADCASIDPQFLGITDSRVIGLTADRQPNGNLIRFSETGWPNASPIQALTSVTYRISTGEIVDADIDMNAQYFTLGIIDDSTENPNLILDLQNTLTHEIGHFLGLDHTQEESFTGDGAYLDATMFASAPLAETKKRSLEDDDINGICTIYPSRSSSDDAACDCQIVDGLPTLPDRACVPLGEPVVPQPSDDTGRSDAGSEGDTYTGLVVRRHDKGCDCSTTGDSSGPPWGTIVIALSALACFRTLRRSPRFS
jgi:MYXO-CTERM domain-containing protein